MSKKVLLVHRDMWEAKLLLEAKGRLGRVAMSVIDHYWGNDARLLRGLFGLVWPGFQNIRTPFVGSPGRVMKDGTVCADMILDNGDALHRNFVLFSTLSEMQGAFRRVADRLKLSDADRVDMFAAIQNWISVDYRQRFDEVEDKPRLNGHAHG